MAKNVSGVDPNSIVVGGIAAGFFVASATSSLLGIYIFCHMFNSSVLSSGYLKTLPSFDLH
jgi:hypothetical protein